MGGTLYYRTTPYTENPVVALEALQAIELERYNFARDVQFVVAELEDLIVTTSEDEEPDLRDHYKSEVERMRSIAAGKIPTDFRGRLELARSIYDDGEGLCNILDVDGIDGLPGAGYFAATLLSPSDLLSDFGSEKLLCSNVEKYAMKFGIELGRGQSVCFPLYSSTDTGTPSEWCFVARTVD